MRSCHICGARNNDKPALLNKHALLQVQFMNFKSGSSLLNMKILNVLIYQTNKSGEIQFRLCHYLLALSYNFSHTLLSTVLRFYACRRPRKRGFGCSGKFSSAFIKRSCSVIISWNSYQLFQILLTFLLYCVCRISPALIASIVRDQFVCFHVFSFCAVASKFAGLHAPTTVGVLVNVYALFAARRSSCLLNQIARDCELLCPLCNTTLSLWVIVISLVHYINSDKLALLNKHALLQNIYYP